MSENRRIARAAGLVGGVTLVSRITGLLRDVVTGYFFGAGSAADAFFVAFRLPNLLRRRFWVESENRWVTLRLTNAALRTIDKNGIDVVLAGLRARGEHV